MRTSLVPVLLAVIAAFPGRDAAAQSVQLPTFSYFGTSTTVVVPDGGSTFMGGIDRASSGRTEFGVPLLPFRPFRNTAIGQDYSASGVRVTATIHDFDAMDQALLNTPSPDSFTSSSSLGPLLGRVPAAVAAQTLRPRNPAALAGNWIPQAAPPPSGPAAMTAAEVQAQGEARQQVRLDEAQRFFDRGALAEADGKPGVARVYYQMAARRASGELKEQALAKLDAIRRAQGPAKIAQSQP
ncbi:MAG: hypothetical protein ABSG68_03280 [Thermoguttaceae bacterium]|jgi:hypothetical protein